MYANDQNWKNNYCNEYGTVLDVFNIQIFWDVALCLWASSSRRFEGSYDLHLQSKTVKILNTLTSQKYRILSSTAVTSVLAFFCLLSKYEYTCVCMCVRVYTMIRQEEEQPTCGVY